MNVRGLSGSSKLQKQLKYADRIGVRYALIDPAQMNAAAGQVTVKDLATAANNQSTRARIARFRAKILRKNQLYDRICLRTVEETLPLWCL
jgi:histidyl-tRNA synthetase